MFHVLVASAPRPRRLGWLGPGGATALAGHLILAATVVWAAGRAVRAGPASGPPVVLVWPEAPRAHRPVVPGTVPPVDWLVPVDARPALPAVAVGPSVDARAWWPGAVPSGGHPLAPVGEPGEPGLWSAEVVEQPPVLLAGPLPRYPDLLQRSRVAGRVVVQAVIDTLGRAEPATVTVVRSSHPGFDAPARNYVRPARFRPGRVNGRAVRVLIALPLEFQPGP